MTRHALARLRERAVVWGVDATPLESRLLAMPAPRADVAVVLAGATGSFGTRYYLIAIARAGAVKTVMWSQFADSTKLSVDAVVWGEG